MASRALAAAANVAAVRSRIAALEVQDQLALDRTRRLVERGALHERWLAGSRGASALPLALEYKSLQLEIR